MTIAAEPSWSELVGLVGRLVRVTPCASPDAEPVPLTVADVSEELVCDELSAYWVSLVGTWASRLVAPGRYHVSVDEQCFDMVLTWAAPEVPHQHYRATLVHAA